MRLDIPKCRSSLSIKFILLTSMLIIASSFLTALFVIRNMSADSFDELVSHGRSVAAIMAQNCEYGIYAEDENTLRQMAGSIKEDPNIAFAAVLDVDNRVLMQECSNEAIKLPDAMLATKTDPGEILSRDFINNSDGKKYIDVVAPVVINSAGDNPALMMFNDVRPDPRVIGYIRLVLTQQDLDRRTSRSLLSTVLFASVLAFFGVGLTVFVTRRITAPVIELSAATKGISEGKFDHNIKIRTNDEISDLARAFNLMLTRLKEFKQKVEERTTDLFQANEQMQKEMVVRQNAEEAALSAKARLQHLLTSGPAMVYSCKPTGVYEATFISDNTKDQLGFGPAEFLSGPDFWLGRIHPEDSARVMGRMHTLFDSGYHLLEYRFRKKDGTYLWLRDEMRLVLDEHGRPAEVVGCLIDITARKNLEEQLTHDAFHDALTGLPNRALFMDRMNVAFARSRRRKDYNFAVLFIDLDRFKKVNDSLGHIIGDELLVGIVRKLQKLMRSGDTVARFGGDEFAIILDDIKDPAFVENVAERIHSELSVPFKLGAHEVFTSTSIGIAISNSDYAQPEDLLRDADTAMYQAKARGGSTHVIFDFSMHSCAVAALKLENDLRRAIERKEFKVHYQPIIRVKTGCISGFEALVRWEHPERGLIYPGDFIREAEETGVINYIGSWVLQEACRQTNIWQRLCPSDPPLTISVNLSAKQLSPELPRMVANTLRETGLDPRSLRLEITESMIMDNPESAAELLTILREMDIQVYIDDFGTGYSSLSYLHRFNIDALKIDRSFVEKISIGGESLEIVKAITKMAHNLRMEVVAEGVQTNEQLEYLRALGCEYVQGFLFFKPLESASMETLIEEQRVLRQISPTC